MTGTIGEHLVCADIRRQGYVAFMAPQDCAYDIVLDNGSSLLRVQVKTADHADPRTDSPAWRWNLRRTGVSPNGKRYETPGYRPGDFDLLALVALDVYKIAYMQMPWQQTMVSMKTRDHTYSANNASKGMYFEDCTLGKALAEMGGLYGRTDHG